MKELLRQLDGDWIEMMYMNMKGFDKELGDSDYPF